MTCNKRCPHHVRHGHLASDGKSMEFKELCGLRIKQAQDPELATKKPRGRGRPPIEVSFRKPLPPGTTTRCINHPFDPEFDFFACAVYKEVFETTGLRNGAVPMRDFQYSESLSRLSVTDMELL